MTSLSAEPRPKPPETLPEFFKLLLLGILKKLPLKLLLAGGVALFAWILHTYLLVVTNEGFNAGNNVWLDRILALQGRSLQGSLVWTLTAGLITSTIARIWAYGLKSTVNGIIETPKHVWDWANNLGIIAIPLLIGGYIATIVLGFIVNNSLLVIQIFLIVLGIIIARHTSVLMTIFRLGWSDAQKLVKREEIRPFNIGWPGMFFVGSLVGLVAILPNGRFLPFICGCLGFLFILLASLGIFLRSQGTSKVKNSGKVLFWILLPLFISFFVFVIPAFADDGGWLESGGTLSGWLQSPGAVRAVVMGILPAAGAGAGVLFGTALGGMVSVMGTTGLAVNPATVSPSGQPTTSLEGTSSLQSRTSAAQRESYQLQAKDNKPASGTPPDQPPGSRSADPQTPHVAQQTRSEPDSLSSRHQAETPSSPKGEQLRSQDATQNEIKTRAERHVPEEPLPQSRSGQGADQTGTGQRDLRGVDPTSSGPSAQGSGTAAESANRLDNIEGGSGSNQVAARSQSPGSNVQPGPSAERHQPSGLEDKSGRPAQIDNKSSADALKRTEGSLSDRHQPGGMDEAPPASIDPKPAGIEKSELGASRHSTSEAGGGPKASRHDPVVESSAKPGEMRAHRSTEKLSGPTSERDAGSENLESPAIELRHSREPISKETDIPLPPVPIVPVVLGWDLVVARTTPGSGVESHQRFRLGLQNRIGRHGEIDIKLQDPKVSRQHANIVVEGDKCTITDLQSSNGTFLNGRRITSAESLKPGDAIKIGDTYFVIETRPE